MKNNLNLTKAKKELCKIFNFNTFEELLKNKNYYILYLKHKDDSDATETKDISIFNEYLKFANDIEIYEDVDIEEMVVCGIDYYCQIWIEK